MPVQDDQLDPLADDDEIVDAAEDEDEFEDEGEDEDGNTEDLDGADNIEARGVLTHEVGSWTPGSSLAIPGASISPVGT